MGEGTVESSSNLRGNSELTEFSQDLQYQSPVGTIFKPMHVIWEALWHASQSNKRFVSSRNPHFSQRRSIDLFGIAKIVWISLNLDLQSGQ